MALKLNLLFEQGADFIKVLTWYNPAPTPNPLNLPYGSPKDLSGFTGRMQARSEVESDVVLFEATTTNGGITISGGSITIRVPAATTRTLTFDTAKYDLFLTSGSGEVYRLLEGQINLSLAITR